MTTEFLIEGMTCSNCAQRVTHAIQSVPEVSSATVSAENRNAVVRWNSSKNALAVLQAVTTAGYEAKEVADHVPKTAIRKDWRLGLWFGIVVTVFLMAGEWIFHMESVSWFRWSSFALAGAVQFLSGAPFYRGAWRQIKSGSSNMDTLVALGSTTAFGYSAWAWLSGSGGDLYFMEAAAIITLISLGHWIEARASEKAGSALKSLLTLAPQTARKFFRDAKTDVESRNPTPSCDVSNTLPMIPPFPGGEGEKEKPTQIFPVYSNVRDIPISELQIGDEIFLRPGDRIPVDGIVIEGESAVDESTLTGESVSIEKKSGGKLLAGTVNVNGRLVMRVTATGEETALAHVIAAVQCAQTSRADIQRLGDRVSGVFVPMVVAIAIAVGLWWGLAPRSANSVHDAMATFLWHTHAPAGIAAGFIVAAAVLIVACPCAMGLATPAAIMAGANAAARRGILIRDGVALEKAGKISALIFDKTGTLTVGKPEVANIFEIQSSRFNAKALAASLARDSSHPVSRAISQISAEKMELDSWKEIRGAGIEARVRNQTGTIRLGSLRWLRENKVDYAQGDNFISQWSGQGASVIGLAEENNLLALFAVRDALKPNAANVVEKLRKEGLKIYLVTGDNLPTAAATAKQAGITPENVFAEVRPEQKAEFVKKLQSSGERVAFVGDGINDAPALTQADLGIAVSRASDIARESADIVLLNSEIAGVPEALDLARATLRTIKQNLFWAFLYNGLGVPLAALGFISPIFCAAAMGLSDLLVIGNALRLLRWRS